MRKLYSTKLKPVPIVLLLFTLLGSLSLAASHFRYRNISWRPVSGNTTEFNASQKEWPIQLGFCASNVFAQQKSNGNLKSMGESSNATDEWIYDTTVKNVEFYHKVDLCTQKSAVFLRFINNNTTDVRISWKEGFVTVQVAKETEGYSGEKQLILKPGETAKTDCTKTTNPSCLILPSEVAPTYVADILAFKFKSISVAAVQ